MSSTITPRGPQRRRRKRYAELLFVLPLYAAGCDTPLMAPFDPWAARQEALAFLRTAIVTEENPVVRAQAVEAVESAAPKEGLPWIRQALSDPHEGVRFAACVALGDLQDTVARPALLQRVEDESDSVKAAAIFALHRLGQTGRTQQLAEFLLSHPEANVRANTAMLLGRLGEPGAVELLRRAMYDDSVAVRLQVFEAMLLLGDRRAGQELTMHAHAGPGDWQVAALLAVARSDLPNKVPLLRHRLAAGEHLETRLAAARGLGWCGEPDGFDLAHRSLNFRSWTANPRNPDDSATNQTMRVRAMAALALGAIGDDRAASALHELMQQDQDERVRVAAAAGLLAVLNRRLPPLPFDDAAE